jgi:hypothetical protein
MDIFKSGFMQIITLSVIAVCLYGCASPTTYEDLMPQSFSTDLKINKNEGSINVRTSVPSSTTNPTYKPMDTSEWLDSQKLKQAIEQSIVKNPLFSQVNQGSADYVLEVWVEKIQNVLEITGEGFIFDLVSIWRLTRVKDGKVVVCEFVKGHGASRKMADSAYPPGISAATRIMIEKGLFAISDQSQSHLSAMSTAGSRTAIPLLD